MIKGIAYINLLDGGFGSIGGVEQGFFRKHSIGAKFIYNHFTPHREVKDGEDNYQPDDYTVDKDVSFILEYKYYFWGSYLRESGCSLYGSLSYKTGRNKIANDLNFPHDFYRQTADYNYVGPALGCVVKASEYGNWTIDMQLGYLFGTKKLATEYVVPYRFDLEEKYATQRLRFEILVVYTIDW